MKNLLLAAGIVVATMAYAQEKPVSDSTKNWSIVGQNTLMLNQTAFSNWVGGGANNVGWLAGANYRINYEKGDNLWENVVILGYGQNNTEKIGTRKTQDIINLSTNYGRKISNHWYASGGLGLQTQFAPGYENGNDPKATKISNFMAPGYLTAGVGFTYKPNDNFTMTLRPANARWTFVLDKDLQHEGFFGLKKEGDSSLFQFGFLGTAVYNVKLMDNVTLTNSASVFSNYLSHPERLVLSYNGVLNMKINKYISSLITLDLMYDHNQIKRTQLKQTLGVGIAYNINSKM
ncbi:DUF3078 domain-containing protein [Riemerella columbipharyngis]|uniref:Outer membrane insertion C-terminal signal n=1 Tax=Riemerella columbipharyngis TaxID=1071918 RepID=A0A1G7CUX7_9FLAO|nr:DUF3078 domain-containing protein [Riemerella columbipharyngis]SDE43109.1 Protein of unknown function [Riemerella columbipharyngis]